MCVCVCKYKIAHKEKSWHWPSVCRAKRRRHDASRQRRRCGRRSFARPPHKLKRRQQQQRQLPLAAAAASAEFYIRRVARELRTNEREGNSAHSSGVCLKQQPLARACKFSARSARARGQPRRTLKRNRLAQLWCGSNRATTTTAAIMMMQPMMLIFHAANSAQLDTQRRRLRALTCAFVSFHAALGPRAPGWGAVICEIHFCPRVARRARWLASRIRAQSSSEPLLSFRCKLWSCGLRKLIS